VQKFVARQPILDAKENIFAYELFFRSGLESYFQCDDPDHASSSVVIDSFFLFGLQTLTQGRRAFLNFTRNLILRNYATLLPNQQVGIEILETADVDESLVRACRELKSQGYLLALDDFVLSKELQPMIDVVDLIKVDFLKTPTKVCRELMRSYGPRGISMVAEKVETREQFRMARDMGYKYFQGYFFSRPETLSGRELPAFKLNYLWLLQAINKEEPDLFEIENVIKREPSLVYRLLRYLNSAIFGFSVQIRSIRHALTLLGMNELRKWTSLVALSGMGADRPSALMNSLVIRAKFCEALAPLVGQQARALDLFLMGLLSMIDTVLERPLPEILHQLAVSAEVKTALLSGGNQMRQILDLVVATEKGHWPRLSFLASALKIPEDSVTEAYLQSLQWSQELFQVDQTALRHDLPPHRDHLPIGSNAPFSS
jgi:EAL and modified HD-GYP domain-containing signal transduction protein